MGQIYLVRHGQASFGASDYDQLSELGAEQARVLGGWIGQCRTPIGVIVTGSLKRHRQTAEACLAVLPQELRPANGWQTDPGFDEYDHTEVLARHRPDFADSEFANRVLSQCENPNRAFQKIFAEAMARWMGGAHDREYRESWSAFRQRCVAALDRLVNSAGVSKSAIVFTSGGPIAAICQSILQIPDRQAVELNWSLVNSAVTKLLYQPGRISLSYLNNFAHLEQIGRAQAITYR